MHCGPPNRPKTSSDIRKLPAMATPIKIALDWTPNTNHAGFYVAKAQGLYAKAGLDVSFISPHSGEVRWEQSVVGGGGGRRHAWRAGRAAPR